MKKQLSLFFLGMAVVGWAVDSLDDTYRFKQIVPIVLNRAEQPVIGEHIENQIAKSLRADSRFEIPEESHKEAADFLKAVKYKPLLKPSAEALKKYTPLFQRMEEMKVDAVILAEIIKDEESVSVLTFLFNLKSAEIIHQSFTKVEDSKSLDSYTAASLNSLKENIERIPFGATVLKRSGFKVVLDRGMPEIKVGDRLSVAKFEKKPGEGSNAGLLLKETGIIEITQTEEKLAFGNIILENKPLEIAQNNKVRIIKPVVDAADLEAGDRKTASIPEPDGREFRTYGMLDVGFAAHLVNISNGSTSSSGVNSDTLTYPGATLRGEIWLTHSFFFDFGFRFGLGTRRPETAAETLSSQISDFRGQIGYRLYFTNDPMTPTIFVKTGYSKQRFVIDPSSQAMTFLTTRHSGMLVGAGAHIPIIETFSIGLDLNTLIFSSFEEEPLSSGDVDGASAWDFTLASYFKYDPSTDLYAKILFQSSTAEFSGRGTRRTTVDTSSQTTRALLLGLNYYF